MAFLETLTGRERALWIVIETFVDAMARDDDRKMNLGLTLARAAIEATVDKMNEAELLDRDDIPTC
jgi:hypothetical protein